jgi:hypothetical protein
MVAVGDDVQTGGVQLAGGQWVDEEMSVRFRLGQRPC